MGNYAGSFSRNFEVYSTDSVPYIDADGQLQHQAAEEYTSTSTPNGDWWFVTGETTISGRIGISGTKHLILCDGATLTLPKGIHLTNGNTLYIYGQSAGTGKLIINGVASQQAGIGGNSYEQCGTLIVNGGELEVTGSTYSAGIGGGYNNNSGTVSLNWKNPTDRIYASSYNSSVTLGGQFMLEGTDTQATTGNIGGKTLVPALTVKFDSNGGSGTMSDVLKGASMDYELSECGFTAPADKEFDCWEIGGTQYNAGGTAGGGVHVRRMVQGSRVHERVGFRRGCNVGCYALCEVDGGRLHDRV